MKALSVETEVAEGEAAFPAMRTTVPELYTRGPEIRDKMLKVIEGASDYILIDSFIVRLDPTGEPVLEALKKKRAAGVRIYIISDSSSRFVDGGEPAWDFLEESGIPAVEYNPMSPHRFLYPPGLVPRDHRKFWVVDGKELLVGGAVE